MGQAASTGESLPAGEGGSTGPSPTDPGAPKLGKSGKKICCACPETKKARDACVLAHGEDDCKELIEAHKDCLRADGFVIR